MKLPRSTLVVALAVVMAVACFATVHTDSAAATRTSPFSAHTLAYLNKVYGLTFQHVTQKTTVTLQRAQTVVRGTHLPARGKLLGSEVAIVGVTGKKFLIRHQSPNGQLCWVLAYPYQGGVLYALVDARSGYSYGGFTGPNPTK